MSRNHSICRREDGIFWYRRNFNRTGAYRVRHQVAVAFGSEWLAVEVVRNGWILDIKKTKQN